MFRAGMLLSSVSTTRPLITSLSRRARDFSTWADFLFSATQRPRISVGNVDETPLPYHPSKCISPFSYKLWNKDRLPSQIQILPNIHWKMYADLHRMIGSDRDCLYRSRELRAFDKPGSLEAPNTTLAGLQRGCAPLVFAHKCEADVTEIASPLSSAVCSTFRAVTNRKVLVRTQHRVTPTDGSVRRGVRTDRTFELEGTGRPFLLWEDKSTFVFRWLSKTLVKNVGDIYKETVPTTYRGLKAVFAKVSHFLLLNFHLANLFLQLAYHATTTNIQPQIRWAMIFSGHEYLIMHITHVSAGGRPSFYCSPVLRFLSRPDSPEPEAEPPIWSLWLYMALTEAFHVNNGELRSRLGI